MAQLSTHAHAQTFDWSQQFGSTEHDQSEDVAVDGLGGVYTVGYENGDALINKFDSSGSLVWTDTFGTSSTDTLNGVAITPLGNFVAAGSTYGSLAATNAGVQDTLLVQYDGNGQMLWTKQYGTSDSEYLNDVAVSSSGVIFAAGTTYAYSAGTNTLHDPTALLTSYDSSGQILWTQQQGSSSDHAWYEGVATDNSDNVYVVGRTNGTLGTASFGLSDAILSKYDSSGQLLWTQQYGTQYQGNDYYDLFNSVTTDADGNAYAVGYGYGLTGQYGLYYSSTLLTKYSSDGELLWSREWDYSNEIDVFYDVYVGPDGSVSAVGSVDGQYFGGQQVLVSRYSRYGTLLATSRPTSSQSQFRGVAVDGDGSIYAGGSIAAGNNDGLLMKFAVTPVILVDPNGSGAYDVRQDPAGSSILITNPPNPFNLGGDTLAVGETTQGELLIDSGATVQSFQGRIGNQASATGKVSVHGAGSTWTNTDQLLVGNAGDGTLNIESGATVTSTTGNIGNAASAVGAVGVRGAGSSWGMTGGLIVGSNGNGTLDIEDGATVTNTTGFLGNTSTGEGTVTVTGDGSLWTSSSGITVGNQGDGVLNILSGAEVSSGSSVIAGNSGSAVGVISVSGPGSVLTSGYFISGSSGSGDVTVENGATINSSFGQIGLGANGDGNVTLAGLGSMWINTGEMYVGNLGSGELIVESAAVVSNTAGYLGWGAQGSGVATVTGAGSAWTNSGALFVGYQGDGTLDIANGGAVSSDVQVAIGAVLGSTGAVTVDGVGSSLLSDGDLSVSVHGQANLSILDGASAQSAVVRVGVSADTTGTGNILVDGAGSALTVTDSIYLGGKQENAGGTGSLSIANAGLVSVANTLKLWSTGQLHINGGTIETGTLDNTDGGNFNFNTGTVIVDGGAFEPDASPAASRDYRMSTSSGHDQTLVLRNSATFEAFDLTVAQGGDATVQVQSGSSITLGRVLNIGRSNQGGTGRVEIDGAGSTITAEAAYIGGFEPGELAITGGGSLGTIDGSAGRRAGGTGQVVVSGDGSMWTATGLIELGLQESATLLVDDGGSIQSSNFEIGVESTGDGSATVSGPNSSLSATSELIVGHEGSGTLQVEGGASVSSGYAAIGNLATATGEAIVSHPGSTLTLGSFGLTVGRYGAGSLLVENGGVVTTAGSAVVGSNSGSTGIATVSGSGSMLNLDSDLQVGLAGEGAVTISAGGQVDVGANLRVALLADSVGDLVVSGAGSRMDIAQSILLGEAGDGSLTVQDGGSVSTPNQLYLGLVAGSSGDLNLDGGVVDTKDIFIGGNAESPGGVGTATVTGGGSLSASANLTLYANGTLNLADGVLSASQILFNGGGAFNWTGGRLAVGTYHGDLIQTAGTLAAGASPGVTNITGNYTLDPGGTLEVELAGQGGVAGVDFDFYDITGDASLNGGVIDVVPLAGFTEVVGHTYDVLTAANITVAQGTIDNLRREFSLSVEPGGNGSVLRLTQATLSESDWINPAGGDFHTGANWSGGATPGVDRPMRFDLPGETYGVTYSGDSTSPWARVESGDVTLDLNGHTQTLTSIRANAPSFYIGSGAATTVTGGSFLAEEVVNSGTLTLPSTGEVVADSYAGGGVLNLTGGKLTTGSFTGSFNLEDGELAVVGGVYNGPSSMVLDGEAPGDNVTLTFDGIADRSFTANRLGDSNQATFNIRGGTTITSSTTYMGYSQGSSGVLNVEGASSGWNYVGGPLLVGQVGHGELNVRQGAVAQLNSTSMTIGQSIGSSGAVEVDGSGSTLDGVVEAYIGVHGQGSLTVRNGATASQSLAILGYNTLGTGLIVVDGLGSQYANSTNMTIGNAGGGAVSVTNGGQLNTGTQGYNYATYLGNGGSSVGTVLVSGEGSRWDAEGRVYVGGTSDSSGASGRLTVAAGGAVDVTQTLQVWSTGRIDLAGGSIVAGNLNLASSSVLSGHGSVEAAIDSLAKVVATGGLLEISGASVILRGDTYVTSSGALSTSSFSPYTEVQGGAVVANSTPLEAGKVLAGYGIVVGDLVGPGINLLASSPSGTVDFHGNLDVGSESATIYSQGRPVIDGALSFAGGELSSPTGSLLLDGSGVLSGFADLTGTEIFAELGSTIVASGGTLSLGDNSHSGFYSNGSLSVENDSSLILNDSNGVVLDSGATVVLGGENATLTADSGLTLDFGGNIIGHGAIDTPNNPVKPLINNGHIAGVSPSNPVTLTGYVKGVGTLDNVIITGADAPGFSPATVNRGSVQYSGKLEIEIGGTNAGEFDRLNHVIGAGDALLGGELVVSLLDGYTPSAGDTVEFLAAIGSVTGVFAVETLPAIGGGLLWNIVYDDATVALHVEGVQGDYNYDGLVDAADYAVWRNSLDAMGAGLAADGNGSGVVDSGDYAIWRSNYGKSIPLQGDLENTLHASAPEPSAVLLSLLTVVGLVAPSGLRWRHLTLGLR